MSKEEKKKVEEKKETSNEKSTTKLSPKDAEKIIADLAGQGKTPAEIGLILRDKHGIPSVRGLTGKKLCKILQEAKINYVTEKKIIEDRVENLKKHLENNKHDYSASRALTKQLWAIRRHS